MKTEIRLSGSGGQGLILAGVILAESAILSKLNAVQSQSYGPEARGGASKAEVIISDEDINFPKVIESDILVSLTQKSFDEYSDKIKQDSIIIIDESITIDNTKTTRIYKLPILKSASEIMEKGMSANIVTLGIIAQVIKDINQDALKKSIDKRVPRGTEEINLKAFDVGYSMKI